MLPFSPAAAKGRLRSCLARRSLASHKPPVCFMLTEILLHATGGCGIVWDAFTCEDRGRALNKLSRVFLCAAAVGIFATGAISNEQQPAPAQAPNVQVIDMTAKKYKYTPSVIHVKRGMKVQLRIKALDHIHGFKINVYPDGADAKGAPGLEFTDPEDCYRLPKGEVTTIEFVAHTAGNYSFKCCVFCGLGHMGMKGELVVDD